MSSIQITLDKIIDTHNLMRDSSGETYNKLDDIMLYLLDIYKLEKEILNDQKRSAEADEVINSIIMYRNTYDEDLPYIKLKVDSAVDRYRKASS